MTTFGRSWLAAALAVVGSASVYSGALLNAAALGGTLGDILIMPGIALLATSPIPIRLLPLSRRTLLFLAALRYLPLPVFILSGAMLAPAIVDLVNPSGGSVRGLVPYVVLTIVGLFAITWPELVALHNRLRRRGRAA